MFYMSEQIKLNITEDKRQQIDKLVAIYLIRKLCEQGHLSKEIYVKIQNSCNK